MTAINKDPYARGRVIFDILNEPDAYGLRWEVSSNPHVPSITTNYLRFMDMASSINHSARPVPPTQPMNETHVSSLDVPARCPSCMQA